MALNKRNKAEIKLNKKHQGKEFANEFRFVGKVAPVRKKDEVTDSWNDVPFYEEGETFTGNPKRTLQFNIETANRNELKVELRGFTKKEVWVYSSTHKKSSPVAWADRFDKSKYPDETYHLIQQEFDQAEEVGNWIEADMWVDVQGEYEFDEFTNDEGKTFKIVRRKINRIYPLKNGEVQLKGLTKDTQMRVYDSQTGGRLLGQAKAKEDGVAYVKVGWLNPEGGKLYICKVDGENEGQRIEQEYTSTTVETERMTVLNNIDSEIYVEDKASKTGKKKPITYVRNFRSEDFVEINEFTMQLGIKSTYQDEETKDTKVNGVYLSYGKERSMPMDVELITYYQEAEEGKTALADAFSRLNRLDFLVVEGIDNNRAEYTMVEVGEKEEDDNPFEDVGEKTANYEQVAAGTKKGLEILRYLSGTYVKELLSEDDIELPKVEESAPQNDDPFENTSISDDDLPF
ncbi:hypothetical protein ACU3L3_07380 [Priestia endophytica]